MGIEDREYMTYGSGYRPGRTGPWSAIKLLIIVNVVVFVVQSLTWRSMILERWFALIPEAVLHGQIWRLTTYDFLHDTGEIWHLVFNMWLLWLAGRRVQDKYGSAEFLAFYLVAGILSGAFFMFWGMLTHSPGIAIGASGAAVAVMIVYAMNWPHEKWYIWGVFPIPVMFLALVAVALDVYPMLQQLQGRIEGDGIAHSAHVGGMLFGFFYVRQNWRLMRILDRLGLTSLRNPLKRRPRLRVHRPPVREESFDHETVTADMEERLDQLLEKIALHGEASLSDEEREFLTATSRRYRNRR